MKSLDFWKNKTNGFTACTYKPIYFIKIVHLNGLKEYSIYTDKKAFNHVVKWHKKSIHLSNISFGELKF